MGMTGHGVKNGAAAERIAKKLRENALEKRVAADRIRVEERAAAEKKRADKRMRQIRKMSDEEKVSEAWRAIDFLFPRHRSKFAGVAVENACKPCLCCDDSPNGSGNFGCARCDAIVTLENRGLKIWPRHKKGKS